MMKKLFFLWVFGGNGFCRFGTDRFPRPFSEGGTQGGEAGGKDGVCRFLYGLVRTLQEDGPGCLPAKESGGFFQCEIRLSETECGERGQDMGTALQGDCLSQFLVLDTDGEVQASMKGALGADEFMNKIEEQLNPDYAPERLTALYAEGNRTPEVVNRYAMYLLVHNQEKPGMKVVDDYYASLTEAARLKTENAFLFTRYTMKLDDEKAEFMVAHRKDFDGAVQKEIEEKIRQLYHTE